MKYSKKTIIINWRKDAFTFPLIVATCFVINLFKVEPLQAQEAKKTIQHSTEKLKAFEGFYRFQNNKEAFLQITANGNNLVLKQLWDGKEIVFEQDSALDFYSKAQSFPLKFKDSAGMIIQVLAFNKDVWDKIKNYKPVIKKEIQLSGKQLKTFEGKYKMNGGDEDDSLQITAKGNKLILKQLWDGREIVFAPESALEFFCKDQAFPLKFSKGQDGAVTQVLAFNKDVWLKVK